jgi:hypothetical protein
MLYFVIAVHVIFCLCGLDPQSSYSVIADLIRNLAAGVFNPPPRPPLSLRIMLYIVIADLIRNLAAGVFDPSPSPTTVIADLIRNHLTLSLRT